ncbi:MAG: hypothetical protein COA61_004935 [Zetaproteobacteria bacterium]|nr:hypothetical protein [Zetaproteobacteria bacterium]
MDSAVWSLSSPEQLLSLFGSVVILIAYFLTVAKPDKKVLSFYLSILGSIALLIMALMYANAGLILLEISWISINAWGIWRAYEGKH